MAFPNVAVRLHGCSPGNEACEFEQGSTNHFITPNIVSGVSLEGAFIKKTRLFLRQLWNHLNRRVYLTLSLRVFDIMIDIILDKCTRVPLQLSIKSCTVKIVKVSIFAVFSFKI